MFSSRGKAKQRQSTFPAHVLQHCFDTAVQGMTTGSRCNLLPASLLMQLLWPSGHFPFKKKIQQHSKLPVYQLTLLTGAPGVSTAMLLYKLQSLLMMH
jgi:hypothetical protein